MNKYGQLAMERVHAEATEVFRQIEDPETVFEELGERIEAEVVTLTNALEETSSTPGEGYLDRVGRLGTVLRQAEEIAMHEALAEYLSPTSPEPEQDEVPSRERIDELIADLQGRRDELSSEEFDTELSRLRGLYR